MNNQEAVLVTVIILMVVFAFFLIRDEALYNYNHDRTMRTHKKTFKKEYLKDGVWKS